jgi:hypothetical protein
VAETGRIFSICFSERFVVPATLVAAKLIADGAIGRVVHTIGLGPHRLNRAIRPAWHFDAAPMAASWPISPRTRSTSSCSSPAPPMPASSPVPPAMSATRTCRTSRIWAS